MRHPRARLADDSGITLVEVIVVCLLGILVLTTVGGVYVSSLGIQKLVGSLNQSTSDGQLVASSVDSAVRNGSEFEITTLPSGDQLLRVRTIDASAGAIWHCTAYFFSLSASSIRMTRTADGTVIATPTSTTLASWTLLAEGIERPAEGTVFSIDPLADTVIAVDFTAVDSDGAGTARIKFSTPLMPEAEPEESCF